MVCKAKDIPSDFTIDISKVRLLDRTNPPTFPFFIFCLVLIHSTQLSRDSLPLFISVSRAQMEIGDKFFLRDMDVPEGVKVKMSDDKVPIIKIAGKGR